MPDTGNWRWHLNTGLLRAQVFMRSIFPRFSKYFHFLALNPPLRLVGMALQHPKTHLVGPCDSPEGDGSRTGSAVRERGAREGKGDASCK